MDLAPICSQLSNLAKEVDSLKQQISSTPSSSNNHPLHGPRHQPSHTTEDLSPCQEDLSEELSAIKPVNRFEENFISEEAASSIISFLSNEPGLKTEGSRKTIAYGPSYRYMGAKSTEVKEMPAQIQPLLDTLNQALPPGSSKLNSMLVNVYNKKSTIPRHSDNEMSISPNSEIVCVSLGATRKLSFECISDNSTAQELSLTHRSMYSMSRDSQNFFRHFIDAALEEEDDATRYSLTFRSIHYTNLNSTFLVGDSNFGQIKFGAGKGFVGASTPGIRTFAKGVDEINPLLSTSYKNIVIMCGTNNLKQEEVQTREDIVNIYKRYKGKIELVRKFNNKANIYVCPVLPTRDRALNEKIFTFNYLLWEDLVQHSHLNVKIVRNLGEFLDDQSNLLKVSYHLPRSQWKAGKIDSLHLNHTSGVRYLVKCIKDAIFETKREKGSRLASDRLYSNATRGGPEYPVR